MSSQVLMIWESSLGSRRVGDWVNLLELCEQRSVSIFVTTHGRCYDPGNAALRSHTPGRRGDPRPGRAK